ncbi:MAG: hypothetical protein CMO55_12355 [Verrucomicrobiales bacterium]|nr:hypothetical protein [Verrucomicrobiales bacterium]
MVARLFFCLCLLFVPLLVSAQEGENAEEPELYTNVYPVPPTFLTSDAPVDPANPFSSHRMTAREFLETYVGMEFGPGAFVSQGGPTSQLIIRNTLGQLNLFDDWVDKYLRKHPKAHHLIIEHIEVDQSDFSRWMLDNRLEADATPLRKTVQDWVKRGRARIAEIVVLSLSPGEKARSSSGQNVPQPRAIHPPQIPGKVSLDGKAKLKPIPAIQTEFVETDYGLILTVDPTFNERSGHYHLKIDSRNSEFGGYQQRPDEATKGDAPIQQPITHTSRIQTEIDVRAGEYAFLGSTNPLPSERDARDARDDRIVLQFLRLDFSQLPRE